MIAVTGNTYPVKTELQRLGGQWDAANKRWILPANAETQVKKLRVPVGGHEELWEPCRKCGNEPVDSSGLCSRCRGTQQLQVERVMSDDEQAEKILSNRNDLAMNLYGWASKQAEMNESVTGTEVASGAPFGGGYHVKLVTDGTALYAIYIHHYEGDRDRCYLVSTDRMKSVYKQVVQRLITEVQS